MGTFQIHKGIKGTDIANLVSSGYLGANTILTLLNFYWFKQMITAVSKRFSKKEKVKRSDKAE